MLIVGLTGSIGMGKSTAANHLRARQIPVLDADAVVHGLYAGPLIPAIEAEFPGTTGEAGIDRQRLSAALAVVPDGFKRLEKIVHPAVREAERAFLRAARARNLPMAVLEIPLLFETGADRLVDATIVVSTDPVTQRSRVLARPTMTADKLDAILARQLPDAEKRRCADFVVDTSGPVADTQAQIDDILSQLPGRPANAYRQHWA